MSKNKKGFIHYCCVSINEGLNTDLSTSDLLLDEFDKKVFQKLVFVIVQLKLKNLLLKKNVCNYCMELLENEDQDNPRLHIIWTENKKYRVFSNFYCAFLDRVFRHENIKNKCGKINNEAIDKHINAHINDSCI